MKSRIRNAKEIGLDLAVDAYPTIIEALVKQAEQGSCPHAKLVFELLEPRPQRNSDDEEEPDRPSLAEYLIEQLQLEPPPDGSTESAESSSAA